MGTLVFCLQGFILGMCLAPMLHSDPAVYFIMIVINPLLTVLYAATKRK